MLQPSATGPGLSKTIGAAGVPMYSGSSNFLADENEYTWCRMLSRLGKLTAVPTITGSTRGTNSLLTWSITASGGRGGGGASEPPAGGIATARHDPRAP